MKTIGLKLKFTILWVVLLGAMIALGVTIYQSGEFVAAKYAEASRLGNEKDLLQASVSEALQTGQALRNLHINIEDSRALANLGKAIDNLTDLVKKYEGMNRKHYEMMARDFDTFITNTRALHQQAATKSPLSADQIKNNTTLWRAYKAKLIDARDATIIKSEEVDREVTQTFKDNKTHLLIWEISVMIVFSFLFLVATRYILNNVSTIRTGLVSFFDYLNKKSDAPQLLNITSMDEFGEMAQMIDANISAIEKGIQKDNQTVQNALSVVHHVKEGQLSKKIEAEPNNPELQEFKKAFNEMLEVLNANTAKILKLLQGYTQNDFTGRVDKEGLSGEFGLLVDGVNGFGDQMSKMFAKNLENGLMLKQNAMILRNFVESLATSSNEQAASLEESSAALEEMTGNISSNTEKASIMAIKAGEAKEATVEGEDLASKTVTSMEEIEKATSAINEAVSIIENIAFQTNILSLNAAVEAAGAGEAGKGFAVVAQEVRNLANKSAEAAKTIQALTDKANEKAKGGTEVSQLMIEGFKAIANKISETVDLVNDVTNANKEQMTGIEQINDAVAQLDQMTQENARVANSTDSVANQVSTMAETLTNESLQKNFQGKEQIIALAHENEQKLLHSSEKQIHGQYKKLQAKSYSQYTAQPKRLSSLKKNTHDEGEMWESF